MLSDTEFRIRVGMALSKDGYSIRKHKFWAIKKMQELSEMSREDAKALYEEWFPDVG